MFNKKKYKSRKVSKTHSHLLKNKDHIESVHQISQEYSEESWQS